MPDATPQDDSGAPGGLGALRMAMSGQAIPGTDLIEKMATDPVVPPGNAWLHFASGALAPTTGGKFSESLGNALGQYAGAQDKEAELKAKYMPIVAQALLQRQMQSFTMAQKNQELTNEWDGSLTAGLTGLLHQETVTPDDVFGVAQAKVAQGQVPGAYARTWLQNMPTDPKALRDWVLQKAISAQDAPARLGSVTPKGAPVDTGPTVVTPNTNPNSPGVGAPIIPPVVKGLTPESSVPKTIETPNGPAVISPVSGGVAPAGSPAARTMYPAAAATPPPGAPPVVATPSQPSGAPGSTPTAPLAVDPQRVKVDATLADEYGKYAGAVNDKVGTLAELNTRMNQMRDYTSKFTSGASADFRGKVGAFAKDTLVNLGILPPAQATALGDRISGGDLASMQAFQKLSVQGAMEALKGALSGGGAGTGGSRITQAEFAVFQKNNPNIDLDPNAMEKINNFISGQYQKALQEQQFTTNEYKAGTPVNDIRAKWDQLQGAGENAPHTQTGVAKGSAGAPRSSQLGVTLSGKKFHINPATGLPEYD